MVPQQDTLSKQFRRKSLQFVTDETIRYKIEVNPQFPERRSRVALRLILDSEWEMAKAVASSPGRILTGNWYGNATGTHQFDRNLRPGAKGQTPRVSADRSVSRSQCCRCRQIYLLRLWSLPVALWLCKVSPMSHSLLLEVCYQQIYNKDYVQHTKEKFLHINATIVNFNHIHQCQNRPKSKRPSAMNHFDFSILVMLK